MRDQDSSLKEVEVNTTLTLPRIVDGEKVWTSDTYSADGPFQVTVTELTDNIVLNVGDKHYNMSGSSTDAAISANARKHTVELRNNSSLTLKRPAARRDQSNRRSGTA